MLPQQLHRATPGLGSKASAASRGFSAAQLAREIARVAERNAAPPLPQRRAAPQSR
jgi:hypothetical protein